MAIVVRRPEDAWSQMAPNMSLAAARAHAGEREPALEV